MADEGKWFNHKACLAKKGLLDALFSNLNSINFEPISTPNFQPVLIARHSQRLGELLDRCLNIRKDIRELEVLAVKAGTDYDLFINTSKIDEDMEILRLQSTSKKEEQKGFQKAASTFKETATLEKALSEMALGRDAALGEDLKTSDNLKSQIETRWKNSRKYQDDYHAMHKASGNAHNYKQRAELLLNVLTVLLDEALARAAALATGINLIYGVEIPDVPRSVTLETLDGFAVWALRTIRSLAHAAEQETVFEVIIPLVQPWLPTGEPLVDAGAFNTAISNAKNGRPIPLSFELPHNEFLDTRARLKGIGVSFGNEFALVQGVGIDQNQTADVFTRLTLKIAPPRQKGLDERPEVLIGNVGLHSASAMSWVEGNAIENCSPFGTWNIVIHPFFVWKDGALRNISNPEYGGRIKDLKLALRFYVPGAFVLISRDIIDRTIAAAGAKSV